MITPQDNGERDACRFLLCIFPVTLCSARHRERERCRGGGWRTLSRAHRTQPPCFQSMGPLRFGFTSFDEVSRRSFASGSRGVQALSDGAGRRVAPSHAAFDAAVLVFSRRWGARAWRGMGQRRPSAWRRHGARRGNPGRYGCTCAASASSLPRGWPILLSSPRIVAPWCRPPCRAPAGPRCPGRMCSVWSFQAHDACCGLVRARWPSGTLGLRGVARAFSHVYSTVQSRMFFTECQISK